VSRFVPSHPFRFRGLLLLGAIRMFSLVNPVNASPSPALGATRFENNGSYSVIYLTIDGVQQFPHAPMGISPGSSFDIIVPVGFHTYEVRTGFWNADGRFELYTYSGSFNQVSDYIGSVSITNPNVRQLATRFKSSGYWSGEYLDANGGLHVAAFRFYSDGSWSFYDDGRLITTGTFGLVSRSPWSFRITFTIGDYQGELSETDHSFTMSNGPASWRTIKYTHRGA